MAESIRREELDAIDFSDLTTGERIAPITPGDVLSIEFMEPSGLSADELAGKIGLPPQHVAGVLQGERAIDADLAIRLAGAFGTSAELWMNLQSAHDLRMAGWRHGRNARAAA